MFGKIIVHVLDRKALAWRGADEDADRCCGASAMRRWAFSPCMRSARSGCSIRNVMANVGGAADADGRPVAAGASHRPRQSRRGISGEIARRDRDRSCAASGTISAASAPSSPISTGCGTTTASTAAAASLDSDETERSRSRLRDDGKPALVFAAHLANWELPARRRRTPTASTRPCSTAGPTCAPYRDAVIATARRLHGQR